MADSGNRLGIGSHTPKGAVPAPAPEQGAARYAGTLASSRGAISYAVPAANMYLRFADLCCRAQNIAGLHPR